MLCWHFKDSYYILRTALMNEGIGAQKDDILKPEFESTSTGLQCEFYV